MNIYTLISSRILKKFRQDCIDIEKNYRHTYANILKIVKWHKFSDTNIESLKELPFTEYSDYESFFEKALQTKINPLTGEKVLFFLKSTGSTGKQKYIPLTKSYSKNYLSSLISRGAVLQKTFNIFKMQHQHAFFIPGVELINGLPSGHMGLYLYNKVPSFFRSKWALPIEIANNVSLYQKYGDTLVVLRDLDALSGTIPGGLNAFYERIVQNKLEIIKQIKNPDTVMAKYISLNKKITKSRILYVENVLSKDKLSLNELWPKIKFLSFWKAGAGESQLLTIRHILDEETEIIDQVYNSTEGAFNIPWPNKIGGPVLPKGIILEFLDVNSGITYFPWQLTIGKEYELLVTNFIGMLRYRIGDYVKCTGFYENSPEIHFISRKNNEISFGWYTISLADLNKYLAEMKCLMNNCIVAPNPSMMGLSIYWQKVRPLNEEKIISEFLIKSIPYFEERLKDGTAKSLTCYEIPANLFNLWKITAKSAAEKALPEKIKSYILSLHNSL